MTDSGASSERPTLAVRILVEPLRLLLRYPAAALTVALALGAAAVLLSVLRLGYKSGRADLIDPRSEYNRLWLEYVQEFGDQDDALIVVEGDAREQVVPVLRELSNELAREQRLFKSVLHEVDLRKIRSKGLHYLNAEELGKIGGSLGESTAIVQGEWSRLQLGTALGGLAWRLQTLPPADAAARREALAQCARYSAALQQSLAGPPGQYASPWPELPAALETLSTLNAEYLLTKEGKLGFVLLHLDPGSDKLAPYSEATDSLRRLLTRIGGHHAAVRLGLTGLPVMENDEMRASQSSMLWASVLSLIGVFVVIIAGFGGVRHALLANLVLLLGMAWAFGFATLTVGHLNILSVTFTATLIGVGIDYGTYYVARYLQIRREGHDCRSALIKTSTAVGPSILTGAVTTAVAFFAAAGTSFTGVAELGIIAGGGLILCAIAQLYVLPVCLLLLDRTTTKLPESLPIDRWFAGFWIRPRGTLAAAALLTVAIAGGLPRLWYDYNLLNLQPQGLESVELEKKLLNESDQSVWYAISWAPNREELLRRKEAFLKLNSVERTEEIVSLLPPADPAKQDQIQAISSRLGDLPERPPLIAVDLLEQLGPLLARIQVQVQNEPGGAEIAARLEEIRNQLRRLTPVECYSRLSAFQQNAAGDLLTRLHALRQVANPQSPELADLPPSLVKRFVGSHGQYLLKIYGRGDIWNIDSLKQFVGDVRTVDPRVTGNPIQAYEASREMKRSFELAALYAAGIIAVVLWLDFRNVHHMLLAALPLGFSMGLTFGLMAWLDLPLNPANMIALPLILGIGIDYGVHIVHNYLEQPGRYRMTPATALAVMVDALTTIIGFGSLMIASHQGLQSLGRVLTLGIMFCTLTSMIVLPALLTLISGKRAEREEDAVRQAKIRDGGKARTAYPREDFPAREPQTQAA